MSNKLISDLHSAHDAVVLRAIDQIVKNGSPDVLEPMLHRLLHGVSPELEKAIHNTLGNLKDQQCLPVMMAFLKDDRFRPLRAKILSFVWQSGFNASEFLDQLCALVLEDEFEVAFEAITVIDSADFEQDEPITRNLSRLDNALDEGHANTPLLGNLRQCLLSKLLERE